jgi:hypothetical protein
VLFELEERLGTRILERLYSESIGDGDADRAPAARRSATSST